MALASLRLGFVQKIVQSASFTTLLKRPMAYKSSISLETLYPNSSLKLTTPSIHTNKLSKDGYLIIRSDATRSQQLNLADCMRKLRGLLREAAATRPDPAPETLERVRQRYIYIRSDATRSQQLNLADCMRKLRGLLREAAATRPDPAPETLERVRQ
ncbi:putative beta-keto adipate succinyl CoA transferase, partial [Operophtera brumata]